MGDPANGHATGHRAIPARLSAMPLKDGDMFAGYIIQRQLGAGGMGEVYLAKHPRLPRLDALKILSLDATGDEEFRARFNREAELASTLWHPHIVGVHDRGEFDGRLWISMDYVEGTDVRHLLEQRYASGMPQQDVVEIVTAVAEALDFAHERRLLHRDVKPANILVTLPSDGTRRRVLLTDFGIARETDDMRGLTEAKMAIGTIAYAAPEQLTSKSLDGRADQYALAATAFQLLTGAPPFDQANRAVVVGHHLTTPPPNLSERKPELAHLDTAIAKALAKDPEHRYPRCLDFAQALAVRPGAPAGTERTSQQYGTGACTAPSELEGERGSATSSHTKRLNRRTEHGTAVSVRKRPAGLGDTEELWSFRVQRRQSSGQPHTVVPVELRGASISGPLAEGDVVEVDGLWDGNVLLAEEVINHSAARRGRRRSFSLRARKDPKTSATAAVGGSAPNKARTVILGGALIAVAAVAAAAIFVAHGFGRRASSGPIVTPERATVFSPGGAPDHPGQAGLAIDGDPNTFWPTDTYVDTAPFPVFKNGVGLMLQLSEPTALSTVTVDVPSTGTEVQIRAADSTSPTSLSDTTELTPSVRLQPGHNRIAVKSEKKTSDVLVWISTLGKTDGQSRTAISEITLRAR